MDASPRKHTKFVAVAVGSLFLLTSIATLSSQETKSTKKKSAKTTTESKTDGKDSSKKKAGGRLPNNYSKLDLTDAQRDKIYAIQAKSADEINSLRKQLKALEDKRDQEVEGVLTSAQKTKLKELAAESDGKRKAKGGSRLQERIEAQKKASESTGKKTSETGSNKTDKSK